jgi:hypothetical protein
MYNHDLRLPPRCWWSALFWDITTRRHDPRRAQVIKCTTLKMTVLKSSHPVMLDAKCTSRVNTLYCTVGYSKIIWINKNINITPEAALSWIKRDAYVMLLNVIHTRIYMVPYICVPDDGSVWAENMSRIWKSKIMVYITYYVYLVWF